MKFEELIQSTEWLSIETVFLKLYPDENKNLEGYKEVYEKLKLMPAKESNITIEVSNEIDDFDKEEYVNVSGYYTNPKKGSEEEGLSLAIEFTPWNEWLGMDVDANSLKEFSHFELVAHCLYEMTFVGYEEEDIKAELDKINDSVEEIKNMTDEEKKDKLTSWEDFKKELEDDDNNDDKE